MKEFQKSNLKLAPLVATLVASKFARSLSVILLSLTILNGCDMNNDPMIKEMEAAYATVGELGSSTHEQRDEAVSRALQKYFPPGMKAEEAFKRLRQMKEQGFETSEWRHEGARNWPDGEFKSYLDEQTKRNLQRQYPIGVSEFIAKKQYGFHIRLLATKHVAISFRVVDGSGVISEVKGSIGASGI